MSTTPGYLSNAELAQRISRLVDRWNTREDQMIALLTQPEGEVTVTDGLGNDHLLPSFPQLSKSVTAMTDELDGHLAQSREAAQFANERATHASESATAAHGSAQAAAQSAAQADEEALDAATSATEAAASRDAAATSADDAATYAAAAGASEDAALASEVAAAGSESAAAGSAQAAAASESSAAVSASQADASAAAASASASSASTSASTAVSARNAAQAAQGAAEDARDAASASESAAADSASQAASSATLAGTKASAAEGSASVAQESASEAANQASIATQARRGAEDAQELANLYANAPSGTEIAPGEYSAKHWAELATQLATGALVYMGTWDTSSPYPDHYEVGHLYRVVGADRTVGGIEWREGDQLLRGPDAWEKIDNTDSVTSVAGRVGNVELAASDISGLGSLATRNTVSFSEVSDKPVSYPPSSHTHGWDQVTGKPAQATRWPSWTEVTSKPAQATRWPSWGEVTGKPGLVETSGAQSITGTKTFTHQIVATGGVSAGSSGEGNTLLHLNSERPWRFTSELTGSSTRLVLEALTGGKMFKVRGTAGESEWVFQPTSGVLSVDGNVYYHQGNQLDIGTTAASARSALGLGSAATKNSSAANDGNTLVQRNGSGDVFARLFRSEYTATASSTTASYFMVQNALGADADNYIRPATPYTAKQMLGITWGDVSGKPSTYTPSSHNHSAGNITSGTLSDARLPSSMSNKTLNGLTRFQGSPTSWGVNPSSGIRVDMGTSTSATWMLAGYSGSSRRFGIQVYDPGGRVRFYVGDSWAELNSTATWNVDSIPTLPRSKVSGLSDSSGGKLKVTTDHGWVDIGPHNSSRCHFYTSVPTFYFDKTVDFAGDIRFYNGPRVPKIFVQSGTPSGAQAGDLWFW